MNFLAWWTHRCSPTWHATLLLCVYFSVACHFPDGFQGLHVSDLGGGAGQRGGQGVADGYQLLGNGIQNQGSFIRHFWQSNQRILFSSYLCNTVKTSTGTSIPLFNIDRIQKLHRTILEWSKFRTVEFNSIKIEEPPSNVTLVTLFTGCLSQIFSSDTGHLAINLSADG